jgi:PAS domain S-box-containing protein
MAEHIINDSHSGNEPGKSLDISDDVWISKILHKMGDAIILSDDNGVVLNMNAVAEDLTGWRLNQSQGKPIESIFNAIHEGISFPVQKLVLKALNEKRAIALPNHTVLLKKDGAQFIISNSAIPILDDQSKVSGVALVFRDVTEQSIIKKKLNESEGLLKGILENTSMIVYIKDLAGRYLFINRQKEKVYNIDASKLIGKYSTEHLKKEADIQSEQTHFQVVRENRQIELEQKIKHADGSIHYYHTSKFPLYDEENKMYAVCVVSTDITESKKNIEMKEMLLSKEIVQKSELRYDILTDNMPNMFFSLDRKYRHTSFNKACEKFTGKKAEDVIGKTIDEVYMNNSSLFLGEYKVVMKTGKAKNFTTTFNIGDEAYIYKVNIYPTENGVSVLMTDLTKQKESEKNTLEMVSRLETKNKELRQFAYAVSHDLRAPIARVLGLISLSRNDPGFIINDKTILENVAIEISNLDNVVKDINNAISIRDEAKQKSIIELENELDLIRKVLENEIRDTNAEITYDFSKQPVISSVKSYIYSILYNLISNALKYRSKSRPLKIHVETKKEDGMILLSVTDNGMGIDLSRNGEKIFGLYNRFHGKTIDGKGIGLNLVKVQAESLGGKAEVESEVNVGSTFKIYFPLE